MLLEWVLEALVKNAVDALAGRGGRIDARPREPLPEGGARIRVADDGPGMPRELRARIFDAGLHARRSAAGGSASRSRAASCEENHGGTLALAPTDRGATFDVILP